MSKGIVAKFVRLLRGRAILWASIAVAIAAYSVIPQHHRFPSRLLLAWDIGTFFYLVIVAVTLYRSTVTDIRRHAPIYDEGRFGILVLVLVAVTASFVAIVMELASARANGKTDALALILAGATVVLSWTFTHVMFAVHYAHEFYGKRETGERRGLEFPENPEPDYLDFLYFAFVIGCATATADVNITSRRIRKIALVHGVLSFAFNTAILALTINIAAGLIPN